MKKTPPAPPPPTPEQFTALAELDELLADVRQVLAFCRDLPQRSHEFRRPLMVQLLCADARIRQLLEWL